MYQKKKILLCTENLGPGGAERQLVGLAISLKKRGYDVSVITYIENQFYEHLLKDNCIDYTFCKGGNNKLLRAWNIAKVIKCKKPQTVISFLSAPNKLMCLLKPLGFRLIVSERNTTLSWGVQERIKGFLYRFADVIVANSEYESENIKKHQPALRNKTIAITNFVDTDLFIPTQNKVSEIPVILCVGRITEQKNVLRFIEAVKIMKEKGYKFVVKWFGNHVYKDYCEKVYKKVEMLGLQDMFFIFEPSNNILTEYQQADIFCLPSLHEGYPNVVCEAMSCGLPIACSNVCENPKIVYDGVNGVLFNPKDVDAMADAISRTLSISPAQRMTMGKRNRQQMIENNSIDAFGDKYIHIL